MEQEHKVFILPWEEWKAVRTIEFRLLNVPCILQYYRGVELPKLQKPVADPNNKSMLEGRMELPQDELDLAMLEWVKTFDPAATYKTRLLMCNTDESDARKRVDYLPHVLAEFISNPDFSGLTQEQLFQLNGWIFTQFSLDVPIRTMWNLPFPNYRPTAIRRYRLDNQDAEAGLIDRIRKEISY